MGNKDLKFKQGWTVGQLLEFIKKHQISDDTQIVYQRIEDIYFEKHGWNTVKKEGEAYHRAKKHNEDISSGKYLNKEEYPNITPDFYEKFSVTFSEDELESFKDEYIVVSSPVYYDDDYLYLDAHY